jgi:hypothetical protein
MIAVLGRIDKTNTPPQSLQTKKDGNKKKNKQGVLPLKRRQRKAKSTIRRFNLVPSTVGAKSRSILSVSQLGLKSSSI